MGLLDAFGVGGGKLSVQLQNAAVQPGGTLTGAVVFTGGRRAQNIAAITVKLVMSESVQSKQPDGNVGQTTQGRDVVPMKTLASNVTVQPGQAQPFQFDLQLPQGLPGSQPGGVSYRVHASADIAGEVDPGASADVQVLGGQQQQQPQQQWGGQQPQQQWAGQQQQQQRAGQQQQQQQKQWDQQQQQQQPQQQWGGQAPAALGVGSAVVAQWQDGNWHPGKIVAMQNGMYGVDWDDPALGQSSWVQQQQVQPTQQQGYNQGGYDKGQGGYDKGGYDKGGYDKGQGGVDMDFTKDPNAYDKGGYKDPGYDKGGYKDPGYDKGQGGYKDPNAFKNQGGYDQGGGYKDPNAFKNQGGYDQGGYGKGVAGGGLNPGQRVKGQWQDGGWYMGTVVSEQDGSYWVQWDNPAQGGGSWLNAAQIEPE